MALFETLTVGKLTYDTLDPTPGTAAFTGNATVGGTLAVTGATSLTGNTSVTGTFAAFGAVQLPVLLTKTVTLTSTDAVTIDSTYFGKVSLVAGDFATPFTLPANNTAAGTVMDFIIVGTDSCAPTWSSVTADTLITFNDQQADSVTFGTGHRIGAYIRFIATGSAWVAINMGNHTMTVATA